MSQKVLAEKLKDLRSKAGLTQRALAQEAGVTSGFIAQLEMGDRLPSLDVLLRLAATLQLKRAAQDELMTLYEQAQHEKHQRAVRTRGAAVRNVMLRTRGAIRTRGAVRSSSAFPTPEMSAEEIAREIAADPDLLAAYQNLKAALADPAMREMVLNAIEAFARAARSTE